MQYTKENSDKCRSSVDSRRNSDFFLEYCRKIIFVLVTAFVGYGGERQVGLTEQMLGKSDAQLREILARRLTEGSAESSEQSDRRESGVFGDFT